MGIFLLPISEHGLKIEKSQPEYFVNLENIYIFTSYLINSFRTSLMICHSLLQDNFKLEVFKNMERVSTYLVKKGNYIVNMYTLSRSKEPEYILKRTKSPVR